MHEGASPPAEPPHEVLRDIRGYFRGQQQVSMDYAGATPTEYEPMATDTMTDQMAAPAEPRNHHESSDEDDVPLRQRRLADSHQESASSPPRRGHRTVQKAMQESPVHTDQSLKRPGPKPYAAKPVAKNDMDAKLEVIREIEQRWGKNFIEKYIPKCHRPLQKKKNGKRSAYREHESNPKKWLPSVLKAVLMVSRHTSNKAFLKKAMGDVVRYRIKHTGNRKPQLVTTDFDVIEDMLTRDWTIDQSFDIRYKHLLLAQPRGQQATDQDIDNILSYEDEDPEPDSDNNDQEEDEDLEIDEPIKVEDDEDEDSDPDISSAYQPKKTYIHYGSRYPSKLVTAAQPKPMKPPKQQLKHPEQQPKQIMFHKHPEAQAPRARPPPVPETMYGYGMSGYGGYGPYAGYPMPGYPPPHMRGPPPPHHMKGYPPPPPMFPWPGYGHYSGYGPQNPGKDPQARDPRAQEPRPRDPRGQAHGYHGMPAFRQPMTPSPSLPPNAGEASSAYHGGHARFSPFGGSMRQSPYLRDSTPAPHGLSGYEPSPRIKREPGTDDRPISIEDYDETPSNYLGEAGEDASGMTEEQMQIAIAENEQRVLMLKAKLAHQKRKKMA